MHTLELRPPQEGVFFDAVQHAYWASYGIHGSIRVPSTSRILELSGEKDFDHKRWGQSLMNKGLSQMGADYFMARVRDIRADVGTQTHALIQEYLYEEEETTMMGQTACPEAVEIFHLWLDKVYPRIGKVYLIEQPSVHLGCAYGFMPDLIAEIDGVLSLADWKTNQPYEFAKRYDRLVEFAPQDQVLREICEVLKAADIAAGKKQESTARARKGWHLQQSSYAYGADAVYGLPVQRGVNFMLSVNGVREANWNRADLIQGWKPFVKALALHHQNQTEIGGHPVYQMAANAILGQKPVLSS